jgi:hypothetical protein
MPNRGREVKGTVMELAKDKLAIALQCPFNEI